MRCQKVIRRRYICFSVSAISLAIGLSLGSTAQAESPQQWYRDGAQAVKQAKHLHKNRRRARNVILFVGDGMGISTVTAARILEGQLRGENGEENRLSFEMLPYLALSKTYNTNQQTSDSAGTMTAIMTGVKTKAGMIAVNQYGERGNCASSIGNELPTFLEQAEMVGMSTGVVTTARLTHSTPAATYAHVPERGWESDDRLTDEAKQSGCKDIARQLIEFPYGDGLEVALGGGRRHFIPRERVDGEGRSGRREDGRDLTAEWVANYDDAAYVWNREQFAAIDADAVKHLLGLFESSHMEYAFDRPLDAGGEPSLSEMTLKAIDVLDNNRKGFFLHVEAGRIDHGHHAGNAYRALTDTIEFSNAVKAAMENVDMDDTLILVTADHSHVFTIAGYPTRGNPILGKVVGNDNAGNASSHALLAGDGMPYTTLGYTNGRGFHDLEIGGDRVYGEVINAGSRTNLRAVDTGSQGFHQEALVPLFLGTHAGEDVAIYAGGPGAYMVHGVQEQNVIYHVMREATRMDRRLTRAGHKKYDHDD